MINHKRMLWITPNTNGIFGLNVVTRSIYNTYHMNIQYENVKSNLILNVHIYLQVA